MKRFVAIQGPTPIFVRWALAQPCELRELSEVRFVESSFRQLRSFRELSLARIENRVVDGIAIHPDSQIDHPAAALGFSQAEVCYTAGGWETVNRACAKCSANVATNVVCQAKNVGGVKSIEGNSPTDIVAGCFGFLSNDFEFDWLQMIRGQYLESSPEIQTKMGDVSRPLISEDYRASKNSAIDLIQLFQECSDQATKRELQILFGEFPTVWATIWSVNKYSNQQLELLQKIVSTVHRQITNRVRVNHHDQSEIKNQAIPVIRDLADLNRGIDAAISYRIPFCAELIPSGFVEGQRWTIPRHCRRCKTPWDDHSGCLSCRQLGQLQEVVRLKVIGIRPYLQLESILGSARVEELLTARRKSTQALE